MFFPIKAKAVASSMVALAWLATLAGCVVTRTYLEKSDLKVETQMSSSIFLEPRPPQQKIILVDIRKTVDKKGFDLEERVKSHIVSRGYTLTEDPSRAYYLLQVNILKVGESDLNSADKALEDGFGGILLGAATGAAIGVAVGDSSEAAAAGALIGGAVAGVGDYIGGALADDVLYTAITDIQISERAMVSETTELAVTQGDSANVRQFAERAGDWKRYRTRLVGKANKINLTPEEAVPRLADGIATVLSGIF